MNSLWNWANRSVSWLHTKFKQTIFAGHGETISLPCMAFETLTLEHSCCSLYSLLAGRNDGNGGLTADFQGSEAIRNGYLFYLQAQPTSSLLGSPPRLALDYDKRSSGANFAWTLIRLHGLSLASNFRQHIIATVMKTPIISIRGDEPQAAILPGLDGMPLWFHYYCWIFELHQAWSTVGGYVSSYNCAYASVSADHIHVLSVRYKSQPLPPSSTSCAQLHFSGGLFFV